MITDTALIHFMKWFILAVGFSTALIWAFALAVIVTETIKMHRKKKALKKDALEIAEKVLKAYHNPGKEWEPNRADLAQTIHDLLDVMRKDRK